GGRRAIHPASSGCATATPKAGIIVGELRQRVLDSEESAQTGLLRSTGGIVDPIYRCCDLDYGGLQRDHGPVERRDVCIESLHLGGGITATHGLVKRGRCWLTYDDSHHGPVGILVRTT